MISILGISAFYHDSAAALVQDGKIVAAAQEERFTRKKFDAGFPEYSIRYCLKQGGIDLSGVDYVIFYDKPLLKFERLLETYLAYAPNGFRSFATAMPAWIKEKLYLQKIVENDLARIGGCKVRDLPELLFNEHHQSHAASAFFASPFKNAAVLCMDGVGEWATTTAWSGNDNTLEPLWEINFPHSLGLLYSAFTYFTGFRINSGEYKLMGLAPYGEPKYTRLILDKLVDVKQDGSFRMNMDYFNYATGLTMTNELFSGLFNGPRRKPESPITRREMDIAASIQQVTEEIVLRLARTLQSETSHDYLCLAGGVALNCVANGKLLREKIFRDIWIQPAAGDSGGAVGAALSVWHQYLDKPRPEPLTDQMAGAFLGPAYTNEEISTCLDSIGAVYDRLEDDELIERVADLLADGHVIGWFQGRMEFGPRALGARSIIGDPRSRTMQSVMNLKIKYRESFRPFAPAVIGERVQDYFDLDRPSPYMLLVAEVNGDLRIPMTWAQKKSFGIDKLKVPRSTIPAVTHVDYSARVQTVHEQTNPRFYKLLKAFESRTGCAVLVNTSFNVRGEPIVCTPEDAYRCCLRTEMDYLVLENILLSRSGQPPHLKDDAWKQQYELD